MRRVGYREYTVPKLYIRENNDFPNILLVIHAQKNPPTPTMAADKQMMMTLRETVALAWILLAPLVLTKHEVSAFQLAHTINSDRVHGGSAADRHLASRLATTRHLKLPASSSSLLATNKDRSRGDDSSSVEEYRNAATQFLSNFMSNNDEMKNDRGGTNPVEAINFQAPKIPSTTSMETLASALDFELIQSEWFVTGKVNPR